MTGADAGGGPLPTFLIIGAQKSATRWLRRNLGKHPDIYTAPGELAFFGRKEEVDPARLEWYRQQFAGWGGERIVGESTPGYMMWRNDPARTARRIHEALPDVRLLAVLRNPVDRAYSAMLHHMANHNLPPGADLLQLVRSTPPADDPLGLVSGGWYAASLRPYRQLFGERLLVLLHDDVLADPEAVYRRATGHIGASAAVTPDGLHEVWFSNQRWRDRLKRRVSRRGRAGSGSLSAADRRQLFGYFEDDLAELEAMFDLDLARWHPEPVTDPAGAPA